MIGETTQDYMTAFIATLLVILSFLVIKEIRQSLIKSIFYIAIDVFSLWLGVSKIRRDNRKEELNEQRRFTDSVKLQNLSSKLDAILDNYKSDTARFSDFKKKLETNFHIKDSANIPTKQTIVNHIDRVDYLKQF